MEGFADLLTDAFSEPSVPSFPEGDLDFETLTFNEKSEEDKTESTTTTDEVLIQEATAEATALLDKAAADLLDKAENDNEEQNNGESDEVDFKGVSLMSEILENDYTSSDGESEQEGSVSGDDKEENDGSAEEAGDFFMSIHCNDESYSGDKEDRILIEDTPMAPEEAGNPQDSNKVEGETESDEELAYLGEVPERRNDMKSTENEENKKEREEDPSNSNCEDMTIEQKDIENANDSSELPSLPLQNLQDLIAEVEQHEEKMTDFSGEEHQEAGECFAEYPSDLSSFEYADDGGNNQDASTYTKQNAATGITWVDNAEDSEDEMEGESLYSKDLDADVVMNMDVAAVEQHEEKSEHLFAARGLDEDDETSETSSSSDDEEPVTTKGKLFDDLHVQEFEFVKQLKESQLYNQGSAAFSFSTCADDTNNRAYALDFTNWDFDMQKTDSLLSEYLLTEEEEKDDTPPSDVKQCPADDANSYSEEQTEMTRPSNQGSLDDSFFFNSELESYGDSEQGQLGDDGFEEERNWEQEQERIKAFYRFYDDSDEENEREERLKKVQFCANPLSQVIHYETDSSDTDSLSSSTDREEDLCYAGASEELTEPECKLKIKPADDPPKVQLLETISDDGDAQICNETHKCLSMMKLIMKMGVVIVMGLVMIWLTSDHMDWLGQHFF